MSAISKDFLVKNGLVVATTATIQSTQNSTSTSTGALIVAGGAGIAGDLYVGGKVVARELDIQYTTITTTLVTSPDIFTITNTTDSISTDTGALAVAGGVGIGGDVYIGGTLHVRQEQIITTASFIGYVQASIVAGTGINLVNQIDTTRIDNFGVVTLTAGTDTVVSSNTGSVTVWNKSTLQTVTSRGATTNNALNITNTTNSTSTNTGALQVQGGVGIGGDLWVGGEIVAERLTIQYTTVTTTIVETDDIIQTSNTTQSYGTDTGALTVAGGAGIGGDVYVGGTIYGTIGGGFITSAVGTSTTALNIQVNDVVPLTQYFVALAESKDGSYSPIDADAALMYDTTNNMLTVPNTSATSISISNNAQIGGTLTITGDLGTVTILNYNGVTFRASEITGFIGGETFVPLTSGLGLTASTTYFVVAVFGPDKFILSTTPTGTGIGTVGTQTIVGNAGSAPGLRVTNSATIGGSLTVGGPLTVTSTETSTISGDLTVDGRITGGGIRTTSSATPPTNPMPAVGDIWYNTSNDAVYRYTNDGTGNLYWIDITGPSVLAYVVGV